MSPSNTLLALFLASLTAGLPIHPTSQNTSTHLLNSAAPNVSNLTLAKRTLANPPFDPYSYSNKGPRGDGEPNGDIFRLTKCYCVDTPSRDLPVIYGQYYGSYYGFDYYNYHQNKSYAFSWTCASGELENIDAPKFSSAEIYFLVPKCLGWTAEKKKECWDTGDGNKFCAEVKGGKDYYYWNGQKRRVWNHPPAANSTYVTPARLNDECQRMCQTIPANTPGYMQDVIPSDREHKINLATKTTCDPHMDHWQGPICAGPYKDIPKVWEVWNYIETYTDQADMCKGCA